MKNTKKQLFTIIKIIASILIPSAIGLEIWNIQLIINHQELPIPDILNPILIFTHVALFAHFIEGIIASIYAPTKNKPAIKYGIYTFLVGTVGLLELWENDV
ncbi:hypothetical protein H6F32_14610 [Anabaena sp. FACHB-1237]|uniref:hypothetical protein n=1 Tax=Anabaena sp. FACHB-1237 TaxID=2692769 RepID=UPI0016819D0F|nr:hypothetical protein [Anabaena sp. FACHB-1237]MBD2138780.1 hypothetical protein [Anabaena sp. FACHB-1237]